MVFNRVWNIYGEWFEVDRKGFRVEGFGYISVEGISIFNEVMS